MRSNPTPSRVSHYTDSSQGYPPNPTAGTLSGRNVVHTPQATFLGTGIPTFSQDVSGRQGSGKRAAREGEPTFAHTPGASPFPPAVSTNFGAPSFQPSHQPEPGRQGSGKRAEREGEPTFTPTLGASHFPPAVSTNFGAPSFQPSHQPASGRQESRQRAEREGEPTFAHTPGASHFPSAVSTSFGASDFPPSHQPAPGRQESRQRAAREGQPALASPPEQRTPEHRREANLGADVPNRQETKRKRAPMEQK